MHRTPIWIGNGSGHHIGLFSYISPAVKGILQLTHELGISTFRDGSTADHVGEKVVNGDEIKNVVSRFHG